MTIIEQIVADLVLARQAVDESNDAEHRAMSAHDLAKSRSRQAGQWYRETLDRFERLVGDTASARPGGA
jgi:hypothetical protein